MQIRSQLTKFLGEAANTPKLIDTEVSLESMVKHKYKIASELYKMINKKIQRQIAMLLKKKTGRLIQV